MELQPLDSDRHYNAAGVSNQQEGDLIVSTIKLIQIYCLNFRSVTAVYITYLKLRSAPDVSLSLPHYNVSIRDSSIWVKAK